MPDIAEALQKALYALDIANQHAPCPLYLEALVSLRKVQLAQKPMAPHSQTVYQMCQLDGQWYTVSEGLYKQLKASGATNLREQTKTEIPTPVVPEGWRIEMAPQWSDSRIRVIPPGEPSYLMIEPGPMRETGGVLYALCRAMIAAANGKGGQNAR